MVSVYFMPRKFNNFKREIVKNQQNYIILINIEMKKLIEDKKP